MTGAVRDLLLAWRSLEFTDIAYELLANKPDLAREVVARRGGMSDAQRLMVAPLIRVGARTEALEAETALRP